MKHLLRWRLPINMKGLFFTLFCSFTFSIAAQSVGTIVALHPSVGNTITLNEKKEFHLFPEVSDETFETAQLVRYNDSTYSYIFKSISEQNTKEIKINLATLLSDYYQIEYIKPAPPALQNPTPPISNDRKDRLKGFSEDLSDIYSNVIVPTMQVLLYFASQK